MEFSIIYASKSRCRYVVLDDSLMFRFDKLTSEQAPICKTILIDDEGNIIYQAMKTDGMASIFNYFRRTESLL